MMHLIIFHDKKVIDTNQLHLRQYQKPVIKLQLKHVRYIQNKSYFISKNIGTRIENSPYFIISLTVVFPWYII